MHSLCAYALCAGCLAAAVVLVLPAYADPLTYTWETFSSVPPDGTSNRATLQLSFTVDGPVPVNADDHFADNAEGVPPATQVAYQYPPDLTSFDLRVGNLSVSLADFVSPKPRMAQGKDSWVFLNGASRNGASS